MKSMSALLEALKQTQNDSKLDLPDAEADADPDAAVEPELEAEPDAPDPVAIVSVLQENFPKTYAKCLQLVPDAAEEDAEMTEMTEA